MKHFILPVCMAIAAVAAAASCANENQSMLEPQKINMSKFEEKNGFRLEENGVITGIISCLIFSAIVFSIIFFYNL